MPVLLLCAFAAAPRAADNHPLHPMDPPVAVVRLEKPEVLSRILTTRQGRHLPDVWHRPLSLPGSGIAIPSIDAFLGRLAERNVGAVWFCLAQQGGSLAGLTSAIGWLDGADMGEREDIPAALGLTSGTATVDVAFPGDRQVVLTRDEKTRRLFLEGSGKGDDWRRSLEGFMTHKDAGIWVNPRPLLGIASMYTGVDIRSRLLALGLGVPDAIHIGVFPHGDDAGFFVQLPGLVPEEWLAVPGYRRTARFRDDAPLQVTINPPEMLRSRLAGRADIAALLMALNVNLASLFPHSISLAGWRDDDDRLAWAAVWVMDDGKTLSKTIRRIRSLLRNVAKANPDLVRLEEKRTAQGEPILEIAAGTERLALTIGDVDGEAVLLMANRGGNLPDPAGIQITSMAPAPWITWQVRPDAGMRTSILRSLVDLAQRQGISLPDRRILDELLAEEETGSMGIADDAVMVESRNAMLPLLLPSLHTIARRAMAIFQ